MPRLCCNTQHTTSTIPLPAVLVKLPDLCCNTHDEHNALQMCRSTGVVWHAHPEASSSFCHRKSQLGCVTTNTQLFLGSLNSGVLQQRHNSALNCGVHLPSRGAGHWASVPPPLARARCTFQNLRSFSSGRCASPTLPVLRNTPQPAAQRCQPLPGRRCGRLRAAKIAEQNHGGALIHTQASPPPRQQPAQPHSQTMKHAQTAKRCNAHRQTHRAGHAGRDALSLL